MVLGGFGSGRHSEALQRKESNFLHFLYQPQSGRSPVFHRDFIVPTARMRTGDVSEYATQLGVTVRNPYTGQPFPNNLIPQSMINPVARNVLALVPTANTGTPTPWSITSTGPTTTILTPSGGSSGAITRSRTTIQSRSATISSTRPRTNSSRGIRSPMRAFRRKPTRNRSASGQPYLLSHSAERAGSHLEPPALDLGSRSDRGD
jgi:hypothetical protein